MCSFGQSTALARRTCLSLGMLNLGESKYLGSGQKRRVVPVLRWPTVSTTLSREVFWPSAKAIWCTWPPRRTQTSSFEERALTTETPTPWRPPEKRELLSEHLAAEVIWV